MDTDTRLTKLEDRIEALENLAADTEAKIRTGLEAMRKHPLFGQVAAQFGKILG